MNRRILLLAWGVSLALTSLAEARKWTDTSGNQINADYVRIHEGEVLLRQGTRLIKCPYDRFCELDKAYIRDQMEAEQKASQRQVGLNQIGGPVAPEATDDNARELRTWRDIQGNKVLAQYAGFALGRVELLKDGRRVSYPFAAFSMADQFYVAQILIAEGRADEVPKKKQDADEGSGDYGGGSGGMGSDYAPPESGYEVASSNFEGSGSHESDYGADDGMDYEAESSGSSHSPAFPPSGPHNADSSNSSWPPPSSFAPPQIVMKKKCMKCNGIVPDDTKVGDRCPHCGVTFGYEVGADGKRTSAGESWFYRRLFIRLAIFGFVALIVVAAVLSKR